MGGQGVEIWAQAQLWGYRISSSQRIGGIQHVPIAIRAKTIKLLEEKTLYDLKFDEGLSDTRSTSKET